MNPIDFVRRKPVPVEAERPAKSRIQQLATKAQNFQSYIVVGTVAVDLAFLWGYAFSTGQELKKIKEGDDK